MCGQYYEIKYCILKFLFFSFDSAHEVCKLGSLSQYFQCFQNLEGVLWQPCVVNDFRLPFQSNTQNFNTKMNNYIPFWYNLADILFNLNFIEEKNCRHNDTQPCLVSRHSTWFCRLMWPRTCATYMRVLCLCALEGTARFFSQSASARLGLTHPHWVIVSQAFLMEYFPLRPKCKGILPKQKKAS